MIGFVASIFGFVGFLAGALIGYCHGLDRSGR